MSYPRIKQAYADWLATSPDPQTDAAFLAWLDEPRTVTVDMFLTPEGLISRVGEAVARRVIDTLKAAAASDSLIEMALDRLRHSEHGLNVSDPETVAMLDALAANEQLPLTADDAAAIKALGEATVTRQEADYGLGVVGQPHLDRLRLDGEID